MESSLFLVTMASGLESVAESEIVAKLGQAWMQAIFRGRIVFGCTAPLERVFQLRCVDNIYAYIASFRVGPHRSDLADLRRIVSKLDVTPAVRHTGIDKPLAACRAIVSASRSGKHTYSRFDAAEAALSALQDSHGFRRGDNSSHDIAFRLDIIGDSGLLSAKLTPPSFRFRGSERGFSRAALRPSVAHALIWLSDPQPTDVFLDPFCGSGTIASERAVYPATRIVASDLDPEAVRVAKANSPDQVEVYNWDCRSLDLGDGSVTRIVTNPPWGVQIGEPEHIEDLYRVFVSEAKRVLTADGRIVVLTDQVQAIESACNAMDLPLRPVQRISLHGLVPTVYEIGASNLGVV